MPVVGVGHFHWYCKATAYLVKLLTLDCCHAINHNIKSGLNCFLIIQLYPIPLFGWMLITSSSVMVSFVCISSMKLCCLFLCKATADCNSRTATCCTQPLPCVIMAQSISVKSSWKRVLFRLMNFSSMRKFCMSLKALSAPSKFLYTGVPLYASAHPVNQRSDFDFSG